MKVVDEKDKTPTIKQIENQKYIKIKLKPHSIGCLKPFLTSNVYIDTAIKKGYFRIIRNEKDKRSIFILPSVITIKTFEEFIDRRDILYKGVK